MRYRVAFQGRWQGALLHAFDDLHPHWSAADGATVVEVQDQPALLTLMHRADEFGLAVQSVQPVASPQRSKG
jgi:hypothetical protein